MVAGASTADGLDTLGKRVAHIASVKGYTSASELADEVRARGYKVSRQTMANVYRDRNEPRPGLVTALAEIFGVTKDDLLRDPLPGGDSLFLADLRGIEKDLTAQQRDQISILANSMAAETRTRRAEAPFKDLLDAAAQLSPEHERLLRASIARLTQTHDEEEVPSAAPQRRPGQGRGRSA